MQNDTVVSAELVLRNRSSKSVAMLTMTSSADADPITFDGTMCGFDGASSIGVSVALPQGDLQATNVQQSSDGELVIMDPDGNPTGYSARSYSVADAIGGTYQIYSGIYSDSEGNESEFVFSTDPAAGTVIIVIVCIAAVACLAAIGISAISQNCNKSQADAVTACASGGGLPKVKAKVIYGFNYDSDKKNFRIGCDYECSTDCVKA